MLKAHTFFLLWYNVTMKKRNAGGHMNRNIENRNIYEIFGTDAHTMTKALLEAADIASRIPQGASIALKPNLILAASPEGGATTHAGVLSGCIEYLQGNGFSDISIIESSWYGEGTQRSMKACGYDKVCAQYGVPFYDLKKDTTRRIKTNARPMDIACRALDADYLIDMPVLKGHSQMAMTCALKNMKGCVPDHEKRQFHSDGLVEPIAALAAVLTPDLIIVDSICGDLDFEEGGNPVQTNRMMLGTDPVQMDVYGCQLMGLDLEDVPYIALAEEWGAGSSELKDEDIIRLNEAAFAAEYPQPSGKVKRLLRNVYADSACSACFGALIRALHQAEEEGLSIRDPISIGQGFRGKTPAGLGVGRCCQGAERCAMGCPPTASAILRQLRDEAE